MDERKKPSREAPLADLRVCNFGWVWAAPALGHMLADLGAEVIKIETKKRPDLVRVIPPYLGDVPGVSMYAENTFRSQMSISLDLAKPEAQALVKELVRRCDMVVENFSPRVLEGYGLDYAHLREVKPDLVMISLSAAGQTGPLRQLNSYGNNLSCLTGLDGLQGYPGERPLPFGTSFPDPINGVVGLFAVMAAWRYKRRTGKGQYVDLSQWQVMTSMLGGPLLEYTMNGRVEGPQGNRDPLMAPHGVYRTKGEDQWIAIAVRTDEEWEGLVEVMGRPAWTREERFADLYGRLANQDELDRLMEAWTVDQDNFALMESLQAKGVPAMPAMDDAQVWENPHFLAREDTIRIDHPIKPETIYGYHWKLSKTPARVRRPAPSIGQDNDYVFRELLGLAPEEYERLQAAKVIF
jgi:benzylsuccinate CoA-transferase BbsF subunit